MTQQIADTLDGAADLIQFTGHARDTAYEWSTTGRIVACCTIAAIVDASDGSLDAIEAALDAFCMYAGITREVGIAAWNRDTPTDVVIDALRGAAKAQREIEQVGR